MNSVAARRSRVRTAGTNHLQRALEQFEQLDWTFADAKTNGGVHSIHPYPAKFIPQIPGTLLDLFHESVGGPVLDPFCGSGTTLVECQSRGIRSFGIDLNPIATLISRVKTHPPTRALCPIATVLVERAHKLERLKPPAIPRLDHWFTPGAITAFTRLSSLVCDTADESVRDGLRLALSRIIVRMSRQDSDTRYAAVDRSVAEVDVYRAFSDSARTLDDSFHEQSDLFRQRAPVQVFTRDILAVEPREIPEQVGMVITSPPYPNAYEYWLYHKYRMYWLGEDPIAVRALEIGARPNYFKRRPATAADFHRQMEQCFGLFGRISRPSALICMLVGRSIIRGETIDNAAILRSAAAENSFACVGSAQRKIPLTRKAFNPVHGTINEETLLVFQREDR